MKKATLFLYCLIAPTMVMAQSPFAGTWRLKLDSVAMGGKPDSFLLANGKYKCNSCTQLKTEITADGKDHPVSGSKYIDSASVRIVDPNTVEVTRKLKGKVVAEDKYSIGSQGKTMTVDSTGYREGSPEPTHQTTNYTRVAQGPQGSHAISGDWRPEKIQSASENSMTATFQEIPNGLKLSDPTGEQWEAKFDGKKYPVMHDPGHTMVALKRVDANTIEETDTQGDKTIGKVQWQISSDGRTLKYSFHDERTGGTFTGEAQKQE